MKKIAIISGCCLAALGAVVGVLYALNKMGKFNFDCLDCDCDK